MSWWLWIIIAANVVGYVQTWRTVAYRIAWEAGPPHTEDVVMGLFLACFLAMPWPLTALIMFVHDRPRMRHLGRSGLEVFLRTPAVVRKRQREERIRELERQVGIR